jgi:hypothetical protein
VYVSEEKNGMDQPDGMMRDHPWMDWEFEVEGWLSSER